MLCCAASEIHKPFNAGLSASTIERHSEFVGHHHRLGDDRALGLRPAESRAQQDPFDKNVFELAALRRPADSLPLASIRAVVLERCARQTSRGSSFTFGHARQVNRMHISSFACCPSSSALDVCL